MRKLFALTAGTLVLFFAVGCKGTVVGTPPSGDGAAEEQYVETATTAAEAAAERTGEAGKRRHHKPQRHFLHRRHR